MAGLKSATLLQHGVTTQVLPSLRQQEANMAPLTTCLGSCMQPTHNSVCSAAITNGVKLINSLQRPEHFKCGATEAPSTI